MNSGRALICAIAFVVTSVFFINFCNLVFACGCQSLWNGADQHCNVHVSHGRHCPFCSHGMAGYSVIFAAIIAPQLAIPFWLRRGSWWTRLAVTLAGFPVFGVIVALLAGWWDGYWTLR